MGLDNLKAMVDKAMLVEAREYGDRASAEFYRRLKKGEFSSTKCKSCRKVAFPPREFCPFCFSDQVEWVSLPRRGRLYAFTQQERSLRFGKPDVIGVVELDEVGRIFTRIDASFEELEIGMEVEFHPLVISDEETLHQFSPVGK